MAVASRGVLLQALEIDQIQNTQKYQRLKYRKEGELNNSQYKNIAKYCDLILKIHIKLLLLFINKFKNKSVITG